MDDNAAIEMMTRLRSEILTLRRENERLRPKADAYDTVKQILGLLPRQSEGQGEDILWVIDKELDKLKSEREQRAAQEREDRETRVSRDGRIDKVIERPIPESRPR